MRVWIYYSYNVHIQKCRTYRAYKWALGQIRLEVSAHVQYVQTLCTVLEWEKEREKTSKKNKKIDVVYLSRCLYIDYFQYTEKKRTKKIKITHLFRLFFSIIIFLFASFHWLCDLRLVIRLRGLIVRRRNSNILHVHVHVTILIDYIYVIMCTDFQFVYIMYLEFVVDDTIYTILYNNISNALAF